MLKSLLTRISIQLIVFAALATSCAPQAIVAPTQNTTPTVAETILPPEHQATPLPALTALPDAPPSLPDNSLALPATAPLQWPTQPITLENAKDIQELHRWGRGDVQRLRQLERNPEQFIVQTPLGVYLYQETPPYVLAFMPDADEFAVSDNENLLAVSLKTGDVQIWDLESKSLVTTYAHSFPEDIVKKIEDDKLLPFYVGGMAFSPDGSEIAVGYADGTVELRRIGEPAPYLALKHDSFSLWQTDIGLIYQLSYSPDGETLTVFKFESYTNANRISFWSLPEGKLISLSEAGRYYDFVQPAYLPDDQTLLVLSREDSYLFLTLWNVLTGEKMGRFGTDLVEINSTNLSQDGSAITILGSDSEMNLYRIVRELPGGKLIEKEKLNGTSGDEELEQIGDFLLEQGHYSNVWGEEDDFKVAQVGMIGDQAFRLLGESHWLTFPEGIRQPLSIPDAVSSPYIDISNQSVTWCESGGLYILDKHGNVTKMIEALPIPNCDGVIVSSTSRYAVIWRDTAQYLVNLENGKSNSLQLGIPWDPKILSARFTPDDKFLITSAAGGIATWQVDPPQKLAMSDASRYSGNNIEIIISSDGAFAVTLDAGTKLQLDQTSQIKVWRFEDAFILRRINLPFTDKVQPKFISFALSPDDKMIASGDNFGGIRLWSVESGEELALLEFDYQPVDLTFTRYGSGLIVVLGDGTSRLIGIP